MTMRCGPLFLVASLLVAAGCSQGTEDSSLVSEEAWSPAEITDPNDVLDEARADRDAERYETALQKHIWYHENALKHRPSLAGVRLSFALSDWQQLANSYPPAREKMQAFRERAEGRVRTNHDGTDAFIEFAALNRYLEEQDRTIDLFKWLDANNPSLAERVYTVAQPALVEAEEFEICGKYVNGVEQYEWIAQGFRISRESAANQSGEEERIQKSARAFTFQSAQLVAILANTGRTEEAAEIADQALQEWSSDQFVAQLHDAKNGIAPAPIY